MSRRQDTSSLESADSEGDRHKGAISNSVSEDPGRSAQITLRNSKKKVFRKHSSAWACGYPKRRRHAYRNRSSRPSLHSQQSHGDSSEDPDFDEVSSNISRSSVPRSSENGGGRSAQVNDGHDGDDIVPKIS